MQTRMIPSTVVLMALAGTASAQLETPFPAVFELSTLLEANGGDGSFGTVLEGINQGDRAGTELASIGDLNGDGIDDLVIGAYRADPNGMQVAGEVYVVFGRSDGFPAEFSLADLDGENGFEIEGLEVGDLLGRDVASAGDINHDGYEDVAIGASLADPDERSNAGITYIIYGRDAGSDPFPAQFDLRTLDGSIGFRIDGVEEEEVAGVGVSRAGDINGDGVSDLIIGADYADPHGVYAAGRSYVLFGRDTDAVGEFAAAFALDSLDGSNGFAMNGVGEMDRSGGDVAAAGDVNGDGVDDVIIGARRADALGRYDSGAAYVVFGKQEPFDPAIDLASLDGEDGFAMAGVDELDRCGVSVASAGDLNGDGIGDVVIGAYYANPKGRDDAGESYVVFGKDTIGGQLFDATVDLGDLDGTNGFRMPGVGVGDRNGTDVGPLRDINGDGREDLIVGAAGASPDGMQFAGVSYVIYGRESGDAFGAELDLASLDGDDGFRLEGIEASDRSGDEVSSAGDFNHDGRLDFVVGAFFGDPGGDRPTAGQSFVIFGRGCPADLDHDGKVDSDDFFSFLDAFVAGDQDVCDIDGDRDCDIDDFMAFLDRCAGGC